MYPTGSRRKRANANSCSPLPSALGLFYFLDSVFNTAGEILSAPLPPAPNPASRKGSELSHQELQGLGFPICVISEHQVTPDHLKGPGLAVCSTPVGHQEAVLARQIRLLLSFPLSAHVLSGTQPGHWGPCLVHESAIVRSLGRTSTQRTHCLHGGFLFQGLPREIGGWGPGRKVERPLQALSLFSIPAIPTAY